MTDVKRRNSRKSVGKQGILAKTPQNQHWHVVKIMMREKSNEKCCMFRLDNERLGHSVETVHPGKYTTSNASYLYKDLPKNDTVVFM